MVAASMRARGSTGVTGAQPASMMLTATATANAIPTRTRLTPWLRAARYTLRVVSNSKGGTDMTDVALQEHHPDELSHCYGCDRPNVWHT